MDRQFIPDHVQSRLYESHLRQLKICRNWPSRVSSQHHTCCKNEKNPRWPTFTCPGCFRWTPNLIIMQCALVIDLLYEICACGNCKSGNLMTGFGYDELFCPFSDDDDERESFEQKMRIEESFAFIRNFASLMSDSKALWGLDCLLPPWDTFLEDFWWHFNYFSHHRNHKTPQRGDPGEKLFPFRLQSDDEGLDPINTHSFSWFLRSTIIFIDH